MNSINLDILDNERGRPSENRKLSSRLRTFILKTKAQRQKRPFARVLTIHPTVLTGRIRRICLGPLESRKQSFVAAWPYEPSLNDQVAVYFINMTPDLLSDASLV